MVFLITTTLVLCAGVVVGRLSIRVPVAVAAAPEQHGGGPSWLAQQLNLSATQKQQMDAVWADTRLKIDQSFDRRRQIDKQRDAAVQALLSEEQRAAYQKIVADYRAQRAEADKQRESLIHDAESRSRALLDETQQKKWDELAKDMHSRRGPHRPGGSPDTHPATQPG
jgi:hypothetical protein